MVELWCQDHVRAVSVPELSAHLAHLGPNRFCGTAFTNYFSIHMLSSGMCNTNVDGRQKVMFALTAIRGIGRRISNIVSEQREGTCLIRFSWGCPFCWGETNIWTASEVCKKCDIDLNKRAGEFTTDEVNKIVGSCKQTLGVQDPSMDAEQAA